MTTENHPINNPTTTTTTTVDSSGKKMHGWYKLINEICNSDSPPNESLRALPNSNLNNNNNLVNGTLFRQQDLLETSLTATTTTTMNTNGYRLRSPDSRNIYNTLDSPPNIFHSPSIISIPSTPRRTTEDMSLVEVESTPTTAASSPASTDSKRSPTRSKRITIRKSKKTREGSTLQSTELPPPPITEDISDDDILILDMHKHKTKSIDTLLIPRLNDSIIPLATDLQSLPGHSHDELRDIRFINYSDIDTLSLHLRTCLYIDNQLSSNLTKQSISKTCDNVLHKIFQFYYIKTFRKNLFLEKKPVFNKKDTKQQTLSVINSATSASFITDWTVNRRNSLSTTHRHTPKNAFHILQLNPKTQFSETIPPLTTTTTTTTKLSSQNQQNLNFERVKDILVRTYYPHLHTAMDIFLVQNQTFQIHNN